MRLGDCCKTNLHTYSDKEKWSLIRYLDTGSITEGRIDEIQTLYPGVDKIPSRARRKASVGDILFSTVRPNQKHYGIIEAGTENLLVSTGFTVVTVDTTIAYPYFIYYYLTQSSVIESLQAIAEQSTSTYPSIKPSDIEDIELDLPELETQKKIGSTLRMLDRKIALNEEINDNLQQQLFSLYENMATASPCLKEYALSNLCDFQEGYVNPPQIHPEYFDGEVKWLRAVDINESFIIETSRTLTKAGFESAKKSALLFEPNTIAISKSGTIGRLGIIADYMCGNRAVINIAPHDTNMLAFIYCFLKSKQREFPDMAVGSVQKNLYVSLLEPLSVSIPDNESLTAFNAVGASILGMIHNNCVENTDLANLRDTILPKPMSGEIDVSSVLL